MASNAYAGFINPLPGQTIPSIIINITKWLLGITALLALLSLVVGGLRFVTALGSEDKLRSAKTIILWSLAGLGIVLLAYVIINQLSIVLSG
jgi:hypothetical protein